MPASQPVHEVWPVADWYLPVSTGREEEEGLRDRVEARATAEECGYIVRSEFTMNFLGLKKSNFV